MSDTSNELGVIIEAMGTAGWVRLNGNTWTKDQYSLRTGYVHGEATLVVGCGESGELMTEYRGAHPVTWVCDVLSKVKGMDFAKALADQLSNP